MKKIKVFLQVTIAYLMVSAKHRQKLAQFLRRDFRPDLYTAARSWLWEDKYWRDKIKTLNACLNTYFLAVRPFEPLDLEVLRLEIQRGIEQDFAVNIGVGKDEDGLWAVWFSTPLIELVDEDLRKEVAR